MQHPKKFREYTLPTKIHLGYQEITVEEVSAIDDTQGSYNNESHEIKIKSGMSKREQLNTLLHELLHACTYTYGIKCEFSDDDKEEKVINALGNAFTELFIRNPDLIKFIGKSV